MNISSENSARQPHSDKKYASVNKNSLKRFSMFHRVNPNIIGCSPECGKTHVCSISSPEYVEKSDYAIPCDMDDGGASPVESGTDSPHFTTENNETVTSFISHTSHDATQNNNCLDYEDPYETKTFNTTNHGNSNERNDKILPCKVSMIEAKYNYSSNESTDPVGDIQLKSELVKSVSFSIVDGNDISDASDIISI